MRQIKRGGAVSRRPPGPCRGLHRRRRSMLPAGVLLAALHAGAPAAHPAAAPAITDSGTHTRSLAATCAACHGTDGNAARGFAMPRLAGLPQVYFVEQMRAFRDGTRPATVMQQVARGFTAAEIDALAAYFAALP